ITGVRIGDACNVRNATAGEVHGAGWAWNVHMRLIGGTRKVGTYPTPCRAAISAVVPYGFRSDFAALSDERCPAAAEDPRARGREVDVNVSIRFAIRRPAVTGSCAHGNAHKRSIMK